MKNQKPWTIDGTYTELTLKYDLYIANVGTVAKKGDVLKVLHKENGNPFCKVDGWDDVAFFVHPTLIQTVS